jgi:hypothetical protein
MENGIAAADEPASAGTPNSRESVAAGLSKLWIDSNPRAR